jgi:hypothetical protein
MRGEEEKRTERPRVDRKSRGKGKGENKKHGHHWNTYV